MKTTTDDDILRGKKVHLRALEPDDLEMLYAWENDPRVWQISGTLAPFSRAVLRQLIDDQQFDIYHTRQLRLVICRHADAQAKTLGTPKNLPIGTIDLFEFDPVNLRAGVGILICTEADRRRGYASEALEIACRYASRVLGLRQIWSSVRADNAPCLELFRSTGTFEETGIRRDWSREGGRWVDEIFFQRIFA